MPTKTLTHLADYYVVPDDLADVGESNLVFGLGSGDTIIGSDDRDTLVGGTGNDTLTAVVDPAFGGGNRVSVQGDRLEGGDGSDDLNGSAGADTLIGDAGPSSDSIAADSGLARAGAGHADTLTGNAGSDALYGGIGDDTYVHTVGEWGVDVIDEGAFTAARTAGEGGTDTLVLTDVSRSEVAVARNGDDLHVSSRADLSDGSLDQGALIRDFFDGGRNVVEHLQTESQVTRDLMDIVA
jgi:Ca2+-binding RTX toxin-like protein